MTGVRTVKGDTYKIQDDVPVLEFFEKGIFWKEYAADQDVKALDR